MRTRLGLACVLVSLASCGFEIPRYGHITQTQIAAVRQTVELGPLYPERVGPLFAYDDEMPIAEAMPGDRVVLEAIVVDVDGVRLPDDEIETLWVQCGTDSHCELPYQGFASPVFDVPCSEMAVYTTDHYCLLGTGGARFEFVLPEFGHPPLIESNPLGPASTLYGAVAWGGRRVTDCWAQRRSDGTNLDNCEFIEQRGTFGPEWALWQHAQEIFDWVPQQDIVLDWLKVPANRIPRPPELTILVDGELVVVGRPPLGIVSIQPGAWIDISLSFDLTSQLFQGKFESIGSPPIYEFIPEAIHSRTFTTGSIERPAPYLSKENNATFQFRVDEFAPPGISRVLIGWRDTRRGNDILTVEFEVE